MWRYIIGYGILVVGPAFMITLILCNPNQITDEPYLWIYPGIGIGLLVGMLTDDVFPLCRNLFDKLITSLNKR